MTSALPRIVVSTGPTTPEPPMCDECGGHIGAEPARACCRRYVAAALAGASFDLDTIGDPAGAAWMLTGQAPTDTPTTPARLTVVPRVDDVPALPPLVDPERVAASIAAVYAVPTDQRAEFVAQALTNLADDAATAHVCGVTGCPLCYALDGLRALLVAVAPATAGAVF